MADLMAQSTTTKPVNLHRGDEVTGKVVAITGEEIVLDLGAKAEGTLSKRDLTQEAAEKLQVGDKLTVFVSVPETDSGQAILTLHKSLTQQRGSKFKPEVAKKWQKFLSALERQTTISGQVTDTNKGGLVVEIDGVRGFLPASQVGAEYLGQGLSALVGKEVGVSVIEADPGSFRLILSARKKLSAEDKAKLAGYNPGDSVKGKIVAISSFGLHIDIGGVEGMVYAQEASWDPSFAKATEGKESPLNEFFKAGQEVDAKVVGIDENLGRVNLSLRQLQEDPMAALLDKFQADDVVRGSVTEVSPAGVSVKLEGGVEGFMPSSKTEGGEYSVGQETNFLVDSVDAGRRKVNLVPFITSTKGLIYK